MNKAGARNQAKINRRASERLETSSGPSRSGQDNGKDRVSSGGQAAAGGTQGNQLTHAVRHVESDRSANKVEPK